MNDSFLATFARLRADRRGISALEYALIAGLLSITLTFVMATMGGGLFTLMVNLATMLHNGAG